MSDRQKSFEECLKEKSVLDNIPIKETGFEAGRVTAGRYLNVVSSCPRCGAPVYGENGCPLESVPVVRYSCDCRNYITNLGARTT